MTYCLIKNKNNPPDINGYGSVTNNFLMQQNFISYEEYTNFLNSIGIAYQNYDLFNTNIQKTIDKNRNVFTINKNIDPQEPITNIGLSQLKIYCNWLNTKDLKYLLDFPYNLRTNTKNIQDTEFWIPSYHEWYKAVYYDPIIEQYWLFPNKSNSIDNISTLSPYGLINAGFKYYTILDDTDLQIPENKYAIAGGSKNRNPINAKSGTIRYVSNSYYAGYISARLCKKSEIKKFVLKLYDIYGDGWGPNSLSINDSSNKLLYDNISLKDGYGPRSAIIEVDKVERNINIRYNKQDNLSYENYYEIYDFDTKTLIYKSNTHETPLENNIIALL
jgi:hypothetical protein